ncbi:MAG: HAD-IIIC family phosphatase [Clostridia bacterium]|nr:HAD-IIIC family phosphatase [Clostridia bacterium]
MDKEKIISLLADELEISAEELGACEGELTDMGLTSLKFISFIVKLEEALGIEVLDSDLLFENFLTLEKIFETLKKYVSPKAALKKCLILDADGVLWKGISGEENIVIDGQVLGFQEMLVDLYRRGVLLCICSKNEDFLIERSLDDPRMRVKKEHFVCIRANRTDKVTNICAMAEELNLGLESMVFVDDSDYEIGFARVNLPEIFCVKMDYADPSVCDAVVDFFADVHATSELNRTQLYAEQKAREKEKLHFTSVEEYNASLETHAEVLSASADDVARLSELSERTNQFNLSARRYTVGELSAMLREGACEMLALRVSDKYGDMGIVGMAVIRDGVLEAFMLSCRAFDRGFETVLLNAAKACMGEQPRGVYVATDKNRRYANFYTENGVLTV